MTAPTSLPIRQQIIDAAVASLKNISIANGYYTDIRSVDEYRKAAYEADDLPALGVTDLKRDPTATQSCNIDSHILNLAVIVMGSGDDMAALARQTRLILADLEIWLGSEMGPTCPQFDGLVYNYDKSSDDTQFEQLGDCICSAKWIVPLYYRHTIFEPQTTI